MAKDKVKIAPSIKFCIAFIGLQIITTYITTISVADIWTQLFSRNIYTTFNYVGSIPNVVLALFIPLMMKFVSISKIFYINAVTQIVSCAVLTSIPTILIKSNRDVALAMTFLFLLISSSGFAITQTAIFAFAAEFSNQTVQFYITGLSIANLLYGLYFLPFPNNVPNLQNRTICYYALPLVVHFVSILVFYFTSKKITKKEERRGIEKDESELQRSFTESFKVVLKKKWLIFTLNFCFVLYCSYVLGHVLGLPLVYVSSDFVQSQSEGFLAQNPHDHFRDQRGLRSHH
ncbi:hypothetical protein MHBO_003376 [Bonamia ostreae]|uniref:Uncharacterized protein n=1 Tax=Bonamia ostreae TaxID=126728 RepID=A0ABV2AQS7_9EUKA